MRFPNAAKGVSRIFLAEILKLIAAAATLIGAFMVFMAIGSGAGGNGTASLSSGIGALGLLSAAGVLSILGFILNIVGIVNASKDEESFKTALICLVIGIVTSIISGFFANNPTLASICNIASEILNLVVTIMVIIGIMRLAERLHNPAISAKASTQLKLIVAINVLALICNIIVTFMGGRAASVIASILAIVAAVLSIIQYILYLIFLSQAKAMLQNS